MPGRTWDRTLREPDRTWCKTRLELAHAVGIPQSTLSIWETAGEVGKSPKRGYNAKKVYGLAVEKLSAEDEVGGRSTGRGRGSSRDRWDEARARKAEMEADLLEGLLLDRESVIRAVSEIFGVVTSQMAGLAPRVIAALDELENGASDRDREEVVEIIVRDLFGKCAAKCRSVEWLGPGVVENDREDADE